MRPKTLQAVDVPVIESRDCEVWHRGKGINVVIYDEMLCAGYQFGGKDSCQVRTFTFSFFLLHSSRFPIFLCWISLYTVITLGRQWRTSHVAKRWQMVLDRNCLCRIFMCSKTAARNLPSGCLHFRLGIICRKWNINSSRWPAYEIS